MGLVDVHTWLQDSLVHHDGSWSGLVIGGDLNDWGGEDLLLVVGQMVDISDIGALEIMLIY